MIPYIAVLIVFITSVLFAVYKRVDPFEVGPFRITEKTTVAAALKKAIEVQAQQEKLLTLVEKVPSDELFTEDILHQLGFPADLKDKVIKDILKEGTTSQLMMVKSAMQDIRSRMRSGEISKSMPVIEAIALVAPQLKDLTVERLNTDLASQLETINSIERFLLSRSSTKKSATKEKKNSMRDVFGGVRQAIKASDLDTTDAAPQASSISTQELEDRIANRVAKQVKNSMLSQRSTEEVYGGMPCPFAPVTTDAVAQGQEFSQTKPTSAPDMSQYIRKDSIPCWNCSLP